MKKGAASERRQLPQRARQRWKGKGMKVLL